MHAHIQEFVPALSPSHAIFSAMASISSMNSNVWKFCRELKILKKVDQGSALLAVTREFGIGKTTVMNNRDGHHESQRDHKIAGAEAQGCIIYLKKSYVVRRSDLEAFESDMHTAETNLVG